MVRINFFLMAAVLCLGTSVSEGSTCDCKCGRYSVCDDFDKLRFDVDVNIAELRKWSRYYNFVQDYHRTCEREAAWKQHMEVQLNETTNLTMFCLASQRQLEGSVQKDVDGLHSVQSDLLTRMKNVETSLETLRKDLEDLSLQDANFKQTVSNDFNEIKNELLRIQSICSPPCENGGQCVKNVCNCPLFFAGDRCQQAVCIPSCANGGQCAPNNVCKCASSFYGDRCEDGPKCGVDYDGNNVEGNINSVLVWPWIAAVYKKGSGYKCGGSIIHRRFVLTSAYCVDGNDGLLSLKLGFSDLKNGSHFQERKVGSIHKHPLFRGNDNLPYDIALLEVEEPISFGPFVRPVCLPPREIPRDELFYQPQSPVNAVEIRDYIRSPLTAPPSVSSLSILNQAECKRKIKESGWEKYFPGFPNHAFCTESSSRMCPYRGTPLVQSSVSADGTRTWTQVGVRTACTHEVLANSRLDHLRTWVDETIAASFKQ